MKKIALLVCLLTVMLGCSGPQQWYRPDTVNAGGLSYDSGHSTYGTVGVEGEIGNPEHGVRMEVFGMLAHEDGENSLGGGVSFEIPIGKAK